MAFWEFLLQKDGDRSWLPLESPTVEILEGRYRIVGRSSRVNTQIEIRIAHDALTEAIPVRRTQKRSGYTNQDGLVVIMPFTQLQPGDWELYCTGDLMSDMMGEGWQYGVKLQVLPVVQDAETWEPDHYMPAAVAHLEAATVQREKMAQAAASLAIAAKPEGMVGVHWEQPMAAKSQSSLSETASPDTGLPQKIGSSENGSSGVYLPEIAASEVIQPETLPPLTVTTEQEMYVVRRGKPLMLRGEIRSLEIAEDFRKMPFQLRVRLFAPQNAQVLFDKAYPLNPAALPISFTCEVPLPHHYETYLMLGEVAVELPSSNDAFSSATVVSQSFKVTTDLHELLESIANSFSDPPDVLPPLEALSLPSEHPGLSQPAALPTVQFQPAQTILPPQLRSASPENGDATKDRRSIDLPTFAQAPAAQDATIPQPVIANERTAEAAVTAIGAEALTEPSILGEPLLEKPPLEKPPETTLTRPVPAADQAGLSQAAKEQSPQAPSVTPTKSARTEAFPEVGVAHRGAVPSQRDANSQPLRKSSQSSQPILGDADPEDDWRYAAPQKPRRTSADSPLAPEDIAFRSLNLQQRFLSRLQSLATDSQPSASRQSRQSQPGQPGNSHSGEPRTLSVFDAKQPLDSSNRTQQPIGEDAHLAHDEFVIDEGWEEIAAMQERLPLGGTTRSSSSQKSWSSAQQPPQMPGLTLSPDEPLPVPMLHLPLENLLSGSSVLVLVKLPDSPAKLAVKLWLIDRQSRLLLDGPHWLTDFTPDGFGQWMSRMELLLPQGYLEVQIEAISVEIMTQRESEKTTEARSIQLPFSQFDYDSIDVENL